MKNPIVAILVVAILLGTLSGCSNAEATPEKTTAVKTNDIETVPSETTLLETDSTEISDILCRLEEREAAAAQLHSKLTRDPNLNQADMNDLSYEIYRLWDDLLNEIWHQLLNTLPESEMTQLTNEEREWIQQKENTVNRAAAAYGGGSLAVLSANQQGAALTRERVYVLARLLAGQDISMPAEYNALYPVNLTTLVQELFLPRAEGWCVLNYDIFLNSAQELGFSVQEDEGIFYVYDPDAPGSYLFGMIAQEDTLMIPQLGYCRMTDSGERSIRVDFADDTERYFISAVFWDDGTQVATLQEMMDYLK